jgi:Fuc2NAc and GlcNAc transferase
MINYSFLLILLLAYLFSIFGTVYYKNFAIKNKILANLNFRTLHKKPTPRGGGIIFSFVFVFAVVFFYFKNIINFDLLLVFGVGAGVASIIGYIDDLKGINPLRKFVFQLLLAAWILYFFNGGPLILISNLNMFVSLIISVIFLTWLINVYNFIDGIDGFAITGAILILSSILLVLFISNTGSDLIILFALLLVSCFGFLFFNWPKATIFMGDSGSIFLGYCFGAFIVYSTMKNEISFITWLVVFAYYLSDTTSTTLVRIFTVKKWYHTHRSHAYQNLARILNNHFKVSIGVAMYHIFWLLPLALLTVLRPNLQIIAVILAFLPSTIWSLKFGPIYSKD